MSHDVSKALDILIDVIQNNKEYYDVWKSSIANCFKNEYAKKYNEKGIEEISDGAAKEFLNFLINVRNRRLEDEQ